MKKPLTTIEAGERLHKAVKVFIDELAKEWKKIVAEMKRGSK